MITNLDSIIQEILGNGDRNRWRIKKVLCLMGTINHLAYVAAHDAGAVAKVHDEGTGKDFLRLNAKNRPKLLAGAGFRASLSGVATYLKEFWPLASNSRRTVRDCNDCLERWGFFKRHVFFERDKETQDVNRFSFYTRFDIVGLLRLFEALENYLVDCLDQEMLSIGDRILKKTQDLYEHGAMFIQSLFAFVGASDKQFGSGEAPSKAPGSPEARQAQEEAALWRIGQLDDKFSKVADYASDWIEPVIDQAGNLLDEDPEFPRAGEIFKCFTQRIRHLWNVVGPDRQKLGDDGLPSRYGQHSEYSWQKLIEEDPPGLY